MNLFAFTGNLGRDCEVRHTSSGTAVCTFSVAVTSGYGDNKTTSWVRCNLWGKRAEGGLPGYLIKGAQVAVSGELQVREYEKDGQKKLSVEVRVNEIDLIGGKVDAAQKTQTPESLPQDREPLNDEIPF